MASMYDLTTDELAVIKNYVENGDLSGLTADVVNRFNALHSALTRKLFADTVSARSRTIRLEKRVERLKTADQARCEAGVFTDSGLDSVDVATLLAYHLQRVDRNQPYSEKVHVTNAKLVLVLYEMYASWLYSKKQRLFIEHPTASEYYIETGRSKTAKLPAPQFWRVFKRNLTGGTVPYETYSSLAGNHPEVAAFAKNAAEKYYGYGENALREYFVKKDAFVKSDREHNNGKWNKEITDADIYAWKASEH